MWTLTLARATTAEERPVVVRMVQSFTRRLRRHAPRLKWLAVLEWHPGGHGWHVHMTVSEYRPKDWIAQMWGHGFVDVRRIAIKGDSTSLQAARKAGQYVAKYLTKGGDADAPAHVRGEHRYLRPLGLSWTEVHAEGDYEQLIHMVWSYWPTPPTWLWHSGQDDRWRGPKCVVIRV